MARSNRKMERWREANAIATQQARAAAEAERDRLRAQKEEQRARLRAEKERRDRHVETRKAEAARLNGELARVNQELAQLLNQALGVGPTLTFDALKLRDLPPDFDPQGFDQPETPLRPLESRLPRVPGWLGKKLEQREFWRRKIAAVTAAYELDAAAWRERNHSRMETLEQLRVKHEIVLAAHQSRVNKQHADVDRFKHEFNAGQPDAVARFFSLALERTTYPEGFVRQTRVAYVPESKQLVVEYQLPGYAVVPDIRTYKFNPNDDMIEATARPERERRTVYESVIAQIALRSMHEIFKADPSSKVDSIVFNGHVDTIDRATGRQVKPCLITVRVTKAEFLGIDLARVDPVACLRGLNASVSRNPAELAPVRPVLEFNMVDSRFIDELDVLSALDQRPNLMELTPAEFESLITNLFSRMGLETRLTQPSRDGGVDCVAYDTRPILGGKVVIQAKRYKNTVGVSAVRDLFGTMQNEGASKGILVTTSGYGAASYEFAKGKPLELLSGSHLLHLLAEHAELEARIEPPEGWRDPVADS